MAVPLQMAVSAMVLTVGRGDTLTLTESCAVQLSEYLTCTVYTTDDGGVATGLGEDGSFNPVEGDQL
jgi:hypothetical protein